MPGFGFEGANEVKENHESIVASQSLIEIDFSGFLSLQKSNRYSKEFAYLKKSVILKLTYKTLFLT